MIKFMVVFLCFFYNVYRSSSAPIIKSSGIQWSEPKGRGKGNITVMMIPQNNSIYGNNDTDMIVAVKSDYQILSQDVQLLNLIVNNNKSANSSKYSNDISNITNLTGKNNQKDLVAKYFQAEKDFDLSPSKNNNSAIFSGKEMMLNSESSSTKKYNTVELIEFFKTANDGKKEKSSTEINIVEKLLSWANDTSQFSNITESKKEKIKKNNATIDEDQTPSSKIDFFSFLKVTEAIKENQVLYNNYTNNINELVVSERTAIVGTNYIGNISVNNKNISSNVNNNTPSVAGDSNDHFLNEALNLIAKLKSDSSYYSNEDKPNQNYISSSEDKEESKTGQLNTSQPLTNNSLKEDKLILASDERNNEAKEFLKYLTQSEKIKANIEENSEPVPVSSVDGRVKPLTVPDFQTECFTVKKITYLQQSTSELHSLITTPVTDMFTMGSGMTESKKNISSSLESSTQNQSKEPTTSQVSVSTQHQSLQSTQSNTPTTDVCTEIIVKCNMNDTKEVFQEISKMVTAILQPESSQKYHSTATDQSSVIAQNTAAAQTAATAQITSTIISSQSSDNTSKLPITSKVNKITLESKINCETFEKTNHMLSTGTTEIIQNEHSKEKDSALLLVDPPRLVFKNDLANFKDTPTLLANLSLDYVVVTDVEENPQKSLEKSAELYSNNNNHLMMNIEKGISKNASLHPLRIQANNNKQLKLPSSKEKVLRMHFAGKNVFMERQPSYRSEVLNRNCDLKSENGTESSSFEVEDIQLENLENTEEQSSLYYSTSKEAATNVPYNSISTITVYSDKLITLSTDFNTIKKDENNKNVYKTLSQKKKNNENPYENHENNYTKYQEKITATKGFSTTEYLKDSQVITSPYFNLENNPTCHDKMYIPVNSVKEIIIQIVKNTERPKEKIKLDSDVIGKESEEDLTINDENNHLRSCDSQQQHKVIDLNNQEKNEELKQIKLKGFSPNIPYLKVRNYKR